MDKDYACLSTWKLPADPIALNDLPSYAFDSLEERSRAASLFERYNRDGGMALQTDMEFAQLARERNQRHPVRSCLWIPIERAAAMWFTPRIACSPRWNALAAKRWLASKFDRLRNHLRVHIPKFSVRRLGVGRRTDARASESA